MKKLLTIMLAFFAVASFADSYHRYISLGAQANHLLGHPPPPSVSSRRCSIDGAPPGREARQQPYDIINKTNTTIRFEIIETRCGASVFGVSDNTEISINPNSRISFSGAFRGENRSLIIGKLIIPRGSDCTINQDSTPIIFSGGGVEITCEP